MFGTLLAVKISKRKVEGIHYKLVVVQPYLFRILGWKKVVEPKMQSIQIILYRYADKYLKSMNSSTRQGTVNIRLNT